MKKIFLILLVTLCLQIEAAPKSSLWDYWDSSNENNTTTINYESFDNFLKKYTSTTKENILIYYSRVTKTDRDKLKNFILYLSNLKIRDYNKSEQKAYWVNLYNILTIDVILDNYPVKSILDIKTSGFFKSGPWDQEIIEIEGQILTLNDIEHRILRPIWKDKRLHYLLNCASVGCPNIGNSAYTSEDLETSLNTAEIKFINSSKGVFIDDKKLILSSIYKWYQSDFGENEDDVLSYLKSITNKDLDNLKVSYDYDWELNEVK